jgi:hypothetical protein
MASNLPHAGMRCRDLHDAALHHYLAPTAMPPGSGTRCRKPHTANERGSLNNENEGAHWGPHIGDTWARAKRLHCPTEIFFCGRPTKELQRIAAEASRRLTPLGSLSKYSVRSAVVSQRGCAEKGAIEYSVRQSPARLVTQPCQPHHQHQQLLKSGSP